MYHGFDYLTALDGTPQQRMVMMAAAIDWIGEEQGLNVKALLA